MPKPKDPAQDNWGFFSQCRETLREKIDRYQEKLDSARSIEELNTVKQQAPSVYNTPECSAFYPNGRDESDVDVTPDKPEVEAEIASTDKPENEKVKSNDDEDENNTSNLDREKDFYGL